MLITVFNHGVFMVHNIYHSTASTCINKVHFLHTMDILAQSYELKGTVCCASHHITETINNHTEWLCIYDLCVPVGSFTSIQDLYNNYPNGCFFAAFKKSSCNISNTRASVLPGFPNTRKLMKA